QADAWMPTTGQAAEAPVASSDASDGAPDRKTPKGGRSRRAQKIPDVGSGFCLFLSISSGAKAALHRAPATPRGRAAFPHVWALSRGRDVERIAEIRRGRPVRYGPRPCNRH